MDFIDNLQKYSRLAQIFRDVTGHGDISPSDMPAQPPTTATPSSGPNPMSMSMPSQQQDYPSGDSQTMPQTQMPSQSGPSGQDDIVNLMKQFYTPEHQMIDRYNQNIDMMPTREKPNVLSKIGAVMMGFGGRSPSDIDQTVNSKYYRDLGQWKLKNEALGKGASEERLQNSNERQAAGTVLTNNRYNNILSERQRHDEETESNNRRKTDISEKRAAVYDFKSKHPDWKPVPGKGGTVKFFNPQNPDMIVDTGMDSGTLSDADKLELGLTDDLQKIAARGSEQRKTLGTADKYRIGDISARGEQSRKTNSEKPANATKNTFDTTTDTSLVDAQGKPTTDASKAVGKHTETKRTPSIRPKLMMRSPDGKRTFKVDPKDVEKWKLSGAMVAQ